MTGWQQRTSPIKVGDTVAYSAAFCRSTGQLTGDTPHARGKVLAVEPVGGLVLARIEWDKPNLPERVSVKNLAVVRDGQVMEPG